MTKPAKRPRRYNSTLPVSASLSPSRTTERKTRKALNRSNPARQAKVAKRSKAKHRLYMASECRKAVDARAGGRCEAVLNAVIIYAPTWEDPVAGTRLLTDELWRCENVEGLQHHHKSYHNYGGGEVPEQMLVVCKRCHDYLESLKPARNRLARSRANG